MLEQHNNFIHLQQTSVPQKKGVRIDVEAVRLHTQPKISSLKNYYDFVLLVPHSQPNGLVAQEGKINSFVLVF